MKNNKIMAIGRPSIVSTYTQGAEIIPHPKIQPKVAIIKEITAIKIANK